MAIARISVKDENELTKIVASDRSVVEKGLTVICSDMPIDTKTKIDVLCHDEDGQLVILQLSIKENDNMFFEGLKNLAYINNVNRFEPVDLEDFKSRYPGLKIVHLLIDTSSDLVEEWFVINQVKR